MKNKFYPRKPSRGGPRIVKDGLVEQLEHVLANTPSGAEWVGRWGFTLTDGREMRLGFDKPWLTIPFYNLAGKVEAIKLRSVIVLPGGTGERYKWLGTGSAPPIYLPPGGIGDGPSVHLAEGPFKAKGISKFLGRPVTALASGVGVGLPEKALEHFRGKDVCYFSDPDEEGIRGVVLIAKQLNGVARSLKSVSFPPPGFTVRGDLAKDANDVLWMLRRAYGEQATGVFPGIAVKIIDTLEQSPDLLNNGGPTKDDVPEIDVGGPKADLAFGPEFQDLTQLWTAGRFKSDHEDAGLWCQTKRSWYLWSGRGWHQDDVLAIMVKAKETISRLMHEGVEMKDRKRGDAYLQLAIRLQRREQINAMLDLAKAHLPVRIEDLDRDPMLFNCQNGTLDLRTGTLREHRREDLITKISPVTYDPTAQSPLFDRFIDRIMGGDRDRIRYLQKFFGYSLTGDMREDLFTIFHGDGANGKTTLVNAVRHALGDYARTAAPKLFIHTKWDAHPAEIADLYGARLVIVGETDQDQRLNVARIKAHTGKEEMKARGLYEGWFEFHATHKIVWLTNHKPVIRDTTHAMKRRMRLVPFTVRISDEERDLLLGEKLKAEAAGILRWCVEGCMLWQKEGLESPEAVQVATEEYQIESDPVGRFLSEWCVLFPNASVKRDVLRSAFMQWSEQEGDKWPLNARNFAERLQQEGIAKGLSDGHRTWKGVGLTPREVHIGADAP